MGGTSRGSEGSQIVKGTFFLRCGKIMTLIRPMEHKALCIYIFAVHSLQTFIFICNYTILREIECISKKTVHVTKVQFCRSTGERIIF